MELAGKQPPGANLFSSVVVITHQSMRLAELWAVAMRQLAVLTGNHVNMDRLAIAMVKVMWSSSYCEVRRSLEHCICMLQH